MCYFKKQNHDFHVSPLDAASLKQDKEETHYVQQHDRYVSKCAGNFD